MSCWFFHTQSESLHRILGFDEILHIPHTWGESWNEVHPYFDVIIASDILLYVKTYPLLVKSLNFLFLHRGVQVFYMSWKRRIADSAAFYQLMRDADFSIEVCNEDASLFIFRKNSTMESFQQVDCTKSSDSS